MTFKDIGITDRKANQFIKAGMECPEKLIQYWPRKYHDRRELTGILPKDQESIFSMYVKFVNRNYYAKTVVTAIGVLPDTGEEIKVVWFNQGYIYDNISWMRGQKVLVSGKVDLVPKTAYHDEYYQVIAPTTFLPFDKDLLRIYPTYKKIKGMSDEYLKESILSAVVSLSPIPETIPASTRVEQKLISYDRMVNELHWPTTMEALEAAQRRLRWDDLLYFAMRIELNRRHTALGSPFNIPMTKIMRAVEKSLPFELTEDQANAVNSAISCIREGRRLNALVQGDVGCGKTIIAQLLMIAFAENGYQAALMAPTKILARQHYEGLLKLVEPYGIKVGFVSGKCARKKEQQELERAIREGDYQLIVGTQGLLSESYQFKNLALIIEDEEHKYGVIQRKLLVDKAEHGTHTITMSATPIPRTLGQIIYGDDLQLFSIRTKPSGRKPVTTGIAASMEKTYAFLRSEILTHGRQAYIVCPMITSSEKTEGIASANDIYEMYKKELEKDGITVGLVTGKTKQQEADEVLGQFERNEISVLVSTTVIEVGVNVPNSTAIVIHNAERFGLAQLHQLRGRVGRGAARGVCVLVSEERENERLAALCATTDGFKIAEMDLRLRGAGDLIGSQQSGNEKYLSMALMYPDEYDAAKEAAKKIMDSEEECAVFERAYKDSKNQEC